MKIGMHIIFCIQAIGLQHLYLKGNLQETCIFLARVVSVPMTASVLYVFLQGLHVPYDTLASI